MIGGEGMPGAGEALADSAAKAVGTVRGLNHAFNGRPLQAAFPYALVETGPETDWSHKSGEGREVRLSVTVRDKGEHSVRLRGLMRGAEAAVSNSPRTLPGWNVVGLQFLRSRTVAAQAGEWSGIIEFRARMLASG